MTMRKTRRAAMKDQLMGVMVDAAMREAIRRAAFEERCSMGELIRRAVKKYLVAKSGGRGSANKRWQVVGQ